MDAMKNIILLELLYRQSPANRNAILDMFMETVNKTDVYQRMENILVSNVFSGPDAADLHKKASRNFLPFGSQPVHMKMIFKKPIFRLRLRLCETMYKSRKNML